MEVVLPGPQTRMAKLTKLEYTGSDAIVEKVYRAEDVLSSLKSSTMWCLFPLSAAK